MSKRHEDALAIQRGASNPVAIARALVSACEEVVRCGEGTQREDPAVRLIAHQLASILHVAEFDDDFVAYERATTACEARL